MKLPKIVFVCGTFNDKGGKASSLGGLLYSSFIAPASPLEPGGNVFHLNGGTLEDLEAAYEHATKANVVIWMPNVPNDHPKSLVRSIKIVNRECVLVTSKRVVEKDYSFPAIIQHALALHSNLVLVFRKHAAYNDRYAVELIDPLGNTYGQAKSLNEVISIGARLRLRVDYLSSLRRIGSVKAVGSCPETEPEESEFMEVVQTAAARFAELIPSPVPVTRFVGNAAFRCSFGFPAFRKTNDRFYVSRRNVDKTIATIRDFVPVLGESDGKLVYCGDHKPSVDAPIQGALFALYPKIKYILHGHVYLAVEPWTSSVIPCGALNEVQEVWEHFPDHEANYFAINLRGHGFIAGATEPSRLGSLLPKYYARPAPEDQTAWIDRQVDKARAEQLN